MVPPQRQRRPSIGRQRIEIRAIQKEEARQVSFSKRRAGFFNKASEISILCGADVAAVAFSPAGRAFSFGSPSVNSVINRYLGLGQGPSSQQAGGGGLGPGAELALADLNRLIGELDALRARKVQAVAKLANSPATAWVDADPATMTADNLRACEEVLTEVSGTVVVLQALMTGFSTSQVRQIGGASGFDLAVVGGDVNGGQQQQPPAPPGFDGGYLQGFGTQDDYPGLPPPY